MERVVIAATGPVICCSGADSRGKALAAALSGPVFGAALALAARTRWTLAAEMSAVLTMVNLLPILPLDGGRALRALLGGRERGEHLMRRIRGLLLAALALFGGFCAVKGWGLAPVGFALWLMLAPDSPPTLAKPRGLM